MGGLDPPAAERRATELADRLGVTPGLDTELATLSQGNARKVQVAQAFLGPVELVLLDEVAGALDERGNTAVDELVAEAAQAGATVLRSDPSGVPVHATRHLRLDDGRLCEPIASGAAHLILGPAHDPAHPVRLTVPTDEVDQVLLERLQEGWSVLRVERDEP
jgi:ABC-type lipoprotein export system ATPase subunit